MDENAAHPARDVAPAAPARARMPVWMRVVVMAMVAAAAAVAGRALGVALRPADAAPLHPGLGLDALDKVGMAAIIVVAAVAALVVHEVGHLVGGRLAGFRALLLIVGPVRLKRGGAGWRWRLNRSLALAGGLAASVPTTAMEPSSLRGRTAIMVAGGPISSLVAALVALATGWALGSFPFSPPASVTDVLVSIGVLTFGACSAVVGLVTLIPGQTAGFQTDGARLLLLLRGGPRADRDVAIQAVFGASMGGARPREWSPALLERARAIEDGSYTEIVGWQLAQMHAADSGDRDAARRWLDLVVRHIDRMPEAARPAVRYDAARQLAMRGDVEAARALVAPGGRSLGAPVLESLAEVAILVAEGHHDAARQRLPVVRAMLADGVDPGGAAWLLDDVEALADAIDAADAASRPGARAASSAPPPG